MSRTCWKQTIVNMNNQKCGVIADDVLEIVQISTENIEDALSITGGIKSNFILGIGNMDDRLIMPLTLLRL